MLLCEARQRCTHRFKGNGFSVVYSEEAAKLHAQHIRIFFLLYFIIFLIAIAVFLIATSIIHCLSCVLQQVLEDPCVNLCRKLKEKGVSVMARL